MKRITLIVSSAVLLLVWQVECQSQTTDCSLPTSGARLPSRIDPIGCSQYGGLRFGDLTGSCRKYVALATLPEFFDPWGCTRGVMYTDDPAYYYCNTYEAGQRIPIGLSRLISQCPNIEFKDGHLVIIIRTREKNNYYILKREGWVLKYSHSNYGLPRPSVQAGPHAQHPSAMYVDRPYEQYMQGEYVQTGTVQHNGIVSEPQKPGNYIIGNQAHPGTNIPPYTNNNILSYKEPQHGYHYNVPKPQIPGNYIPGDQAPHAEIAHPGTNIPPYTNNNIQSNQASQDNLHLHPGKKPPYATGVHVQNQTPPSAYAQPGKKPLTSLGNQAPSNLEPQGGNEQSEKKPPTATGGQVQNYEASQGGYAQSETSLGNQAPNYQAHQGENVLDNTGSQIQLTWKLPGKSVL